MKKIHIHNIAIDSDGKRMMNDDGWYLCECGAKTFPNTGWFEPSAPPVKENNMSIHTILSQEIEKHTVHGGGHEYYGDIVFTEEELRSFATRIVEEAQREERERIQQKLQELWSKDPRSVEGKKQGNTDAWMMGYRTAQKEISLTLAPSYRR